MLFQAKKIIDIIDKYVPSRNSAYRRVRKYVFMDAPDNVEAWMVRPNYRPPLDGRAEAIGEELEDIKYFYDHFNNDT